MPLIVLSLSVTVNVNTWSASAARSLISFLLRSRSPVSRVFVNFAVVFPVLMEPASPVTPVCWKPVAEASVIV